MAEEFEWDVFISHSSKDKIIVRPIAERLRRDGLRVWFDEWEIRPGDSIPAKIEEALEHSRVLVLCMSANAFGSDWAQLESGTFRFRDPLNRDRRFIPLRLDETPLRGSLDQFHYINWLPPQREVEYARLLASCTNQQGSSSEPKNGGARADSLQDLARLVSARRKEWRRLQADFESEARSYHDLKLSAFFVSKEGASSDETFTHPNHVINLWQYYGSLDSKETTERLFSARLTKFGVSEAVLSAFAAIVGEGTSLFCKMATRAGSLLPDENANIIAGAVAKDFMSALGPGKPLVVANSNPMARWLNLLLIVTHASFPERLRGNVVAVDPFAASLAVFDILELDQ
jgi:hypothetical protein